MSRPGACETGCAEHRLPLIRTGTIDTLRDAERQVLASVAELRPVVAELACGAGQSDDGEAGYLALRQRALIALSHSVGERAAAYLSEEPADPVVTWWCDRCDGVDAPQPCLGICVWRVVEWAPYESYPEIRRRVAVEWETEQRLRRLLWRFAHTNPRPGQYLPTWQFYAAEARKLLEHP